VERVWVDWREDPDGPAAQKRERQLAESLSNVRPASFAEYKDVSWRARLARGWLLVVAGLTVLSAILEIGHLNLIGDSTTADVDFALAQRVDESNQALATEYLVAFCAYVFSAVFFAAWTFRAYKNITALGAQRPRFGVGWAIGGWFVPIIALFRPKQIVNDIWRTSDRDDPAIVRNWHDRAVPGLLTAWWAMYLISNFVAGASGRMPVDTIENDRRATAWGLASSIFTIVAALLAIVVVSRVTERQRERAAALARLPEWEPRPSGSPPRAATAPGS
jgi:hypothetical protein